MHTNSPWPLHYPPCPCRHCLHRRSPPGDRVGRRTWGRTSQPSEPSSHDTARVVLPQACCKLPHGHGTLLGVASRAQVRSSETSWVSSRVTRRPTCNHRGTGHMWLSPRPSPALTAASPPPAMKSPGQGVHAGNNAHDASVLDIAPQNSRCITARFFSNATTIGSRMRFLILCHVVNAVHIGDPMSRIGRVRCTSSLARRLHSGSSKSQARP